MSDVEMVRRRDGLWHVVEYWKRRDTGWSSYEIAIPLCRCTGFGSMNDLHRFSSTASAVPVCKNCLRIAKARGAEVAG